MRIRTLAAMAALPALLLAGTAHAVRNPDIVSERQLETAKGAPARTHAPVSWDQAPAFIDAAPWRSFLAEHGEWRSLWDAQTGVPQRLWGTGIEVAGASKRADVAERAARELIARHIGLLAPGASVNDFVLVSNTVHGNGNLRTVGFVQYHQGLRVVGGQVSVLFRGDRAIVFGSDALPNVRASVAPTSHGLVAATGKAAAWIADLYDTQPLVGPVGAPVILPLVREGKVGAAAIEYRVVRPVSLSTLAPRQMWDVYVDAATGEPVARVQTLRHGEGTVRYKVPTRYPGTPRIDQPATFTALTVGGAAQRSDATGKVSWSGNAAVEVRTAVTGQFVALRPASGTAVTATLSLPNAGNAVWDQSTNERNDAQLSTYIFTNIVKAYSLANFAHTPATLAWMNTAIPVIVNEAGSCNAYYSPQTEDLHFFPLGGGCENTGRIADVVYHEFGHALHDHAIIAGAGAFDGALSEGVSDYLAATITNDHGMGRGFRPPGSNEPLRDIDPVGSEKVWPRDATGEVHDDGEIIAGTLWDLRKAMIAALGETAGVQRADDMFYGIIQRSQGMTTSFVEALVVDDNDGDLLNGTPNMCLIYEVFNRHGLAQIVPGLAGVGQPVRDGFRVSVPVSGGGGGGCSIAEVQGMSIQWKLRTGTTNTRIDLTRQGNTFVGTIPTQADGSVVQYKVDVAIVGGAAFSFPANAADPQYEFYVGPVTPIYCQSFEANATGWTASPVTGPNEWQWGTPSGFGGDPAAAFSGTKVYGLDLTNNGSYEADNESFVTTPEIDVTGFTRVRLQYQRWLNVEDSLYDQATIAADSTVVWTNRRTSGGSTQHTDSEWRFQDVDLTTQAADGKVRLTFRLKSDGGLEFGGWTLDDVCIVGVGGTGGTPDAGVPDAGIPDAGLPVDAAPSTPDAAPSTPDAAPSTPDAAPSTPDAGETPDAAPSTPDAAPSAPDAAPSTPDASTPTPPDAGGNPDDPDDGDGGCCSTSRDAAGSTALLAFAVGLVLTRRRRRS
jgi:hypothetical protein